VLVLPGLVTHTSKASEGSYSSSRSHGLVVGCVVALSRVDGIRVENARAVMLEGPWWACRRTFLDEKLALLTLARVGLTLVARTDGELTDCLRACLADEDAD
jgi:hypothetical protein